AICDASATMRTDAISSWRRRAKGRTFLTVSDPSSGQAGAPAAAAANALPAETFALRGRSVTLDRRVNAVRGDVADLALAGTLFAPRYARALLRRCLRPAVPVRDAAGDSAQAVSELLAGEAFAVIDISGDWA